jgi:hypothetical protein
MDEIKARSFSGAFTEQQFDQLKESYHFTVVDQAGMGSMSEFDVYASVVAKPAAGSEPKEDDIVNGGSE